MKRLVSVVLALSLLGATAAVAAPNDYNDRGHNDHYRGRHNDGTAVVAGLGFLALAAILASQNHHRHHYRGYDRGYDNYGDRHDYNSGYDRRDDDRNYRDDHRDDDRDHGYDRDR